MIEFSIERTTHWISGGTYVQDSRSRMTILAATQGEAVEKAKGISGYPANPRYTYRYKVIGIKELAA